MATRFELATDILIPHIKAERMLIDEKFSAFQLTTHDGYVMYNKNRNDTELDEFGNEIPVTYYYKLATQPPTMTAENCPWIAVPRSEVDENYIFDNHFLRSEGNTNDRAN